MFSFFFKKEKQPEEEERRPEEEEKRPEEEENDQTYYSKITLLGDINVGKTSIITRYVLDKFEKKKSTNSWFRFHGKNSTNW